MLHYVTSALCLGFCQNFLGTYCKVVVMIKRPLCHFANFTLSVWLNLTFCLVSSFTFEQTKNCEFCNDAYHTVYWTITIHHNALVVFPYSANYFTMLSRWVSSVTSNKLWQKSENVDFFSNKEGAIFSLRNEFVNLCWNTILFILSFFIWNQIQPQVQVGWQYLRLIWKCYEWT